MKPLQLLRSVLSRGSEEQPKHIQTGPGPARSPRFEAWIHAYRQKLASDPARGKWSELLQEDDRHKDRAPVPQSNSRANDAG